jgi:hypothetical protein
VVCADPATAGAGVQRLNNAPRDLVIV